MLGNRKAQAILEIAVLGALLIMAFSIVIGYSENYNRTQSYMQQTFRAALKNAQYWNNSVSWATVDFRRLPNVTNPVEAGALGVYSSGNGLFWSDGKKKGGAETVPKSYFELNRGKITEIPVRDPLFNTTEVSTFAYNTNLNSSTDFIKNEAKRLNSINTSKDLNATDNIGGTTTISGTAVGLGSDLGQYGVYSGGGMTDHDTALR